MYFCCLSAKLSLFSVLLSNKVNSFFTSFDEFSFILDDFNNIENGEDFLIDKHTGDLTNLALEFVDLSLSLLLVFNLRDFLEVILELFISIDIEVRNNIVNNLTQDRSLHFFLEGEEFGLLSLDGLDDFIDLASLIFGV